MYIKLKKKIINKINSKKMRVYTKQKLIVEKRGVGGLTGEENELWKIIGAKHTHGIIIIGRE